MSRIISVNLSLAAVCLVLANVFVENNAQTDKPTLSGARAIIDASQFETLQDAFDALPNEGGLVQIPPGVFEINKPLRVSAEDVTIAGSGTATHIKNVNEDGQPALILAHKEFNDIKTDRQKNLWRIRVADLRITGNEKSGIGIHARNVNEILIDGVTVSYHGGDGIQLDYCYEDPRVCDSLLTYNKGVGLNLIGCHDIVVSSCQFEENQDALHCFDGFNLCMTGNCLDDHLGNGVVIENTYGSVLSGNMIEECNASAIILDRDCYGITLSANVIAHNGGGIDLRDAHGCAISANTFTIMKTDALRIGPNSGRIAVTGNSFCDSYIGDKVRRAVNDQNAGGLTLDGTSDVAIAGNTFTSVRPKALGLGDSASNRVLFSSNVLTDVESDHRSSQLTRAIVNGNLKSEANQ